MEVIENKKYRIEISKPSKDFMKVLGTLFLFSLILFFSTSLFAIVFRFVKLFISNFSKSYIFLIFNGILVLIVKNSGSVGDSSEEKSRGERSEKFEMKVEVAEEEVVVMDVKESEPLKHEIVVLIERQEQEDDLENEEQEHKSEHKHEHEDEEQDEEEEEVEEEMSREELNQKCEEFIRMMRQNIKLEAHQLRCYYA